MTLDEALKLIQKSTDQDGLTDGKIFQDMDQENVKLGDYWFGLDARIQWQLGQCILEQRRRNVHTSLRLNTSRHESAESHEEPMRKARWWGTMFEWSKVDDYKSGFETVHGDGNEQNPFANTYSKANFKWDFPKKENIGIIQIEDFSEGPKDSNGPFTTRYLHSIRDRAKKVFVHLDGAVKTYSKDEYLARYHDQSIKASVYEKLFRTDNELPQDKWFDFVAAFFSGNNLVQEYFSKK